MSVIQLRPLTAATPPLIDLWLNAAQIAEARLPGLPKQKNKVNEFARREKWALRCAADGTELSRTRKVRGGTTIEYHVDLFPPAARAKILAERMPQALATAPEIEEKAGIWSWFDQQNDSTKAEAQRRLTVIAAVDAAVSSGLTRTAAVSSAVAQYSVKRSTLWNWIALIDGVAPSDHLPHLAPRYVGGGKACDVDAELWNTLISDYLRPEEPTFESCYYRTKRIADARGIVIPPSKTLLRKLRRDVDPLVIVKMRAGREAHARTIPPQIRSVTDLRAMQLVNIDGHRWDVFVRWPDGTIGRPTTVAIQDVYSRKPLAWRHDRTENAVCTRLAFADLFRDYGIPEACLLDNGRAFASKWITGGAKTRFRFKIKADDPTGLLPALGINPKWATPYHGQAKPIERMFRGWCDYIAKHPSFSGAYTGNSPMAKPENYGNAAVDYADFVKIVDAEIRALSAKPGSRAEIANGRSLDEAFAESYAAATVGKAGPEQLRIALLTADNSIRTHREHGAITLHGNSYWCEDLPLISGQKVLVRFDPDNLHSEIYVYSLAGRFIATAPIRESFGFANVAAANSRKKAVRDWRKKTKEAEAALDLMTVQQVADAMPKFDCRDVPEVSIVRPVRYRGQTAAALKPVSAPSQRRLIQNQTAAVFDELAAARRMRAQLEE
jgi:putative transposase